MQKSPDWRRMNNKVTMEQKNKLIPELRFPEFVKDGEWELEIISNIADIFKGEQLNRIDLKENGLYPCQNGGINASGYTNKYNCEENTITISEGGNSCGYVNFITEKFWLGGHCYRLNIKNEIDKLFLYQALKFNEENIMKLRVGSGLPNIQMRALREYEILITKNNKEQQKIADCLSSLDELITAHNDKLETLKNHKKGLLQNLFPQENQKVPNYRFPEFVNDGEWEEKKFSNYIKLYRGSSPRPIQEYLTNDENGVNWIKIGDAKNAINSIISKVEEKITKKGSEKSRKVKKGELILANSMSFGKTYEIAIDGCIYDGWFVLREYEKYFYKPFLLQFLNSNYMQNQYEKLSAGGIVQNISSDIVYNTIIFYTSLAEQKKIADCLLAVDNLITAQTEKIEQLKAHKKGLMQGLFPKIEE